LAGRAGKWVDQLAPICSSWDPARRIFGAPQTMAPSGTSDGGTPRGLSCPSGSVIAYLDFGITFGEGGLPDHKFVNDLFFICQGIIPTARADSLQFNEGGEPGGQFISPWRFESVCPLGEVAIGFHGRAGLFIDALGLICVPPFKPGVVSPSNIETMIQAIPNSPTILSPKPNGLLVKGHGAFKIVPSRFLTGTHAQIQLRWLNPPANLQGKGVDFYNYEVPMNLITSPGGIAAPENYLAPGTWELRVRVNQPKVGEWSQPVRFEYYLQNPGAAPKTGLQFGVEGQKKSGTTGTGSSVFRPQTTPSQGLGAGTGIMRRGVEEDQPAEQEIPSAESDKKP